MTKIAVTIEIDADALTRHTDQHLALLWHVAQANPAPIEDHDAGDIAEQIGREIIRRWLRQIPPVLWHHQGHHHYWKWLTTFATYVPGKPDFYQGEWVAKDQEAAEPTAPVVAP